VISRRALLRGGCALTAVVPLSAHAEGPTAPRRACPHSGCRYHRDDDDGGICALSLYGRVAEVDA
jgi:hypothetical protein